MIDINYLSQIIFMLIAFGFMSLVLREQWVRYKNTRTEYAKSRRTLLILILLIFLGNFSHFDPGHLIHAILLALVGFTWWYWYRTIAEELVDERKLEATLKSLATEQARKKAAELEDIKSHHQSQTEAIDELPPKTAKRVHDLTEANDIKKKG